MDRTAPYASLTAPYSANDALDACRLLEQQRVEGVSRIPDRNYTVYSVMQDVDGRYGVQCYHFYNSHLDTILHNDMETIRYLAGM